VPFTFPWPRVSGAFKVAAVTALSYIGWLAKNFVLRAATKLSFSLVEKSIVGFLSAAYVLKFSPYCYWNFDPLRLDTDSVAPQ